MNLEQGDYLEVNFKDSIRQLISNYEIIWGKFIGHDGNGRMIKVDGLTDDENRKREKFAEHFYTCMESIICMNSLVENCNSVEIQNPHEYIMLLNSFMSFQAHVGRIRDNSNKLLNLYFCEEKVKNLNSQLENLYQQRNQVLHGKKLPVRIEDSLVLIAPPMGSEDRPEKWNSDLNWSDFHYSNFEFINEYLKSTVNQVSTAYNNILGNLIEPILDLVKTKNIDIDKALNMNPESKGMIGAQGPISGSTH